MFKDKQIRDAIENTIMLIVFILAIVFLLNVIFFDIINICPKNGISVSCKADTSEAYPDQKYRKYKFIWREADIRYYSCLDVDKIVQDSGEQVIETLKNEIIERVLLKTLPTMWCSMHCIRQLQASGSSAVRRRDILCSTIQASSLQSKKSRVPVPMQRQTVFII